MKDIFNVRWYPDEEISRVQSVALKTPIKLANCGHQYNCVPRTISIKSCSNQTDTIPSNKNPKPPWKFNFTVSNLRFLKAKEAEANQKMGSRNPNDSPKMFGLQKSIPKDKNKAIEISLFFKDTSAEVNIKRNKATVGYSNSELIWFHSVHSPTNSNQSRFLTIILS